jgi:hypothetical protein
MTAPKNNSYALAVLRSGVRDQSTALSTGNPRSGSIAQLAKTIHFPEVLLRMILVSSERLSCNSSM